MSFLSIHCMHVYIIKILLFLVRERGKEKSMHTCVEDNDRYIGACTCILSFIGLYNHLSWPHVSLTTIEEYRIFRG